ncbi:metal-binding protein [Rhodobacteraceae bacterium EhC02]|nr:metal-binding protein [Rhodobacteraceae bacterium EhC02]
MGAPHWLALFGLILGAWIMLYAMALPDDLRASARIFGADFWESLCRVTPDAAGFGRVVLMWALMAAAMMAPTALPAFATYDDLGRSTQTRFGVLVAGYLMVWLGFSVLAGGLQMGLYGLGLVSAFGDSLSAWLSAGLLLIAGLYQFSPVKEACLSKCRAPLTFFMAHWDEGPLRNGVRLGLVCLGCCWALMLLAFVGGVMNIAFMGVATLIMVIEKLPQYGRVLTRPLGAVLIIAGFFVALGAF